MLLTTFGLAGILGIVFMETGLLIGFIFPGDTLLFTAGIMAAADPPFTPLWTLMVGIPIAAALGDQLGFFIGRKAGPRILRSRVMRWIGPEAVEKTDRFFDKYGVVTVLFARFIGVVRTVTPVFAGFSHMNHRAFTLYSALGSTLWGAGIPFLGYMLGGVPFVQEFLHWFIIAGLATVFVPMTIKIIRLWWKNRGAAPPEDEAPEAAAEPEAATEPATSDVVK